MRKTLDNQLKFGTIDISQIELDIKSRDDIPQILIGVFCQALNMKDGYPSKMCCDT